MQRSTFCSWVGSWLLLGVAWAARAADLPVVAAWNFNAPGVFLASQGSGEFRTLGGVSSTNLTGVASDPASPNTSLGLKGFPPQGTGSRSAGVEFTLEGAFSRLELTFDVRVSPTACARLAVLVANGEEDFQEAGTLEVKQDSLFVSIALDLTGILRPLGPGPTRVRVVSDLGANGLYPTVKPRSDGTNPYSPLGVWRLDRVVFRGVVRESVGEPLAVSVFPTAEGLVLEWSAPDAEQFTLWKAPSLSGPWSPIRILYDTHSLELFDGAMSFYRVTSP